MQRRTEIKISCLERVPQVWRYDYDEGQNIRRDKASLSSSDTMAAFNRIHTLANTLHV